MNALRHAAALPLRAKFTLLMATVVVAALTLFGVVLSFTLHRVLLDSTARSLRQSAAAAISEKLNGPAPKPPKGGQSLPVPTIDQGTALAPADTKSLSDLARFLSTRDTAARTTDVNGETRGDGPTLVGVTAVHAPLLDAAVYRAVAAKNTERHLQLATPDGPVMVELIPLTRATSAQTIGVLQLSTSLGDVNDLLDRFRALLLVGTLLPLLVTVALTVLIVRGLLSPLRRMAATSDAIAAGDLSRRVSVPPGGDEVMALARAFNTMVGRLDAAFATQRRFVADASHELRSPLTVVSGGVEMLVAGAEQADPSTRARLLRVMSHETVRMGRLVDELLTLTRFDADPLHTLQIGSVDLTALAREIAEETRLLTDGQIVALDLPPQGAILVAGDADRLRQALLNLCANARAYTPPGGTITVAVRHIEGGAILTVADTGVGITPDAIPRVWERFYRADPSRARQPGQGGLGLGLAIVRAIVEAHGGSATISSAPGGGTTVTLTLPGARSVPPSPAPKPLAGG